MNKASGFITLHRQILDWEWYKDVNTKLLFIHLLITANFKDTRFLGKKIKRGQIVTSLPALAEETGLSVQNVRTALKHLISTGEITDESNNQYRIITVVKYDDYQKTTDELTGNQQATNRQPTGNQQHHNNDNNVNKGNKGISIFRSPTLDEVTAYVNEIKSPVDPEHFFDYYEANGWTLKGGQKMKNWKATIRNWTRREKNGRKDKGSPGSDADKGKGDYSFLRDTVVYA